MPTLRPPSTTLELVVFAFFSALAVIGALSTVLARNPVRSAVGLFVHIVALAALYLNLGAHFLGVIQLLVYAGAVVVLFVFVIMLLGSDATSPRDSRGLAWRAGAGVAMVAVAWFLVDNLLHIKRILPERSDAFGTMNVIGSFLFKQAVLPFELIGITLVIAVVGAFAIARGKHERRALADPDPSSPDEKLADRDSTTTKSKGSDAQGHA
ncbi:MAG: NADH-quinone oxidoreductase subunit J [Deltaproteobacteria bacterium]|nr:NADH-quinone oxidoreductase subunit J [Deltaproteobacteria bacterium]